jgi:hypothetical protein
MLSSLITRKHNRNFALRLHSYVASLWCARTCIIECRRAFLRRLLQHDRVCSIVKSVMATTNDILHTLESNANDTSVSPSW